MKPYFQHVAGLSYFSSKILAALRVLVEESRGGTGGSYTTWSLREIFFIPASAARMLPSSLGRNMSNVLPLLKPIEIKHEHFPQAT